MEEKGRAQESDSVVGLGMGAGWCDEKGLRGYRVLECHCVVSPAKGMASLAMETLPEGWEGSRREEPSLSPGVLPQSPLGSPRCFFQG